MPGGGEGEGEAKCRGVGLYGWDLWGSKDGWMIRWLVRRWWRERRVRERRRKG